MYAGDCSRPGSAYAPQAGLVCAGAGALAPAINERECEWQGEAGELSLVLLPR